MNLKSIPKSLCLIWFALFLSLTAAAQQRPEPPQAKPEVPEAEQSQADESALIESIKNGDLEKIVALLASGVSADAADDEGKTALEWAVRRNRPDIAQLLLDRGAQVDKEDDENGTALEAAACAGRKDLTLLLLEHHADVNHRDRGGHAALLWTSFGAFWKSAPPWAMKAFGGDDEENEELVAIMGTEHYAVAEVLLKAGADVNSQAADCSLTPLMVAALSGDVELTKLLLKHRAKIDISAGEWNALRFASSFTAGKEFQDELGEITDDGRHPGQHGECDHGPVR